MDIFQSWPRFSSIPNGFKVNVSIPEEKPLVRDMVKVNFILPLSLFPFCLQNTEQILEHVDK